MFTKKIISVLFAMFAALYGQAQSGKITGTVLDALTQQPIGEATITARKITSAKAGNTVITDSTGLFSIDSLTLGKYRIVVEQMRYKSLQTDTILLDRAHPVLTVGRLRLLPLSGNLQDVIVTSKAPVVINKMDKIVYNVANDITSQGGVAIDVLKKVPQVSVDVDGNVELQGNPNVRFLINGKPSSIFGNSLADALSSIPASQIKSIEAITTPGAKYEAQGSGGIINIILKDNKLQGINGNFNLSAGSRLENGSLNLNLRHNNFGVNAFFNGNAQLRSQTPFTQNRISRDTTDHTITQLEQNGQNDFTRNGYQTGIGLDWALTHNDNLSAAFSYNHFASHSYGPAQQNQWIQDAAGNVLSDVLSSRNSDTRAHIGAWDWSLGYTRKFKKEGQALDVLYNASYGNPYSNYMQSQTYDGQYTPYMGTASINPGTDRQNNISVEYVQPWGNDFILETGAKTTFQNIYSEADVQTFRPAQNQFQTDPTQSYTLNYKMQIYAVYLSATVSLFHYLDVKAGARYEYTNMGIDFPNTNIPSYGKLLPSLIFSHKLDDKQTVKLSYSRRLERPEYRELNPFFNLSDPYNITTGNPLLKPEIANNFELGYSRILKGGGNIYIAAMERINTQDVKPYTFFYPSYTIGDSIYTNVSISNRQNVGTEYNTGLILTSSIPIGNFNIRENALLFERNMIDRLNGGKQTNAFNWRLNLNASYQFPGNLTMETFGDYRSAFKGVQGNIPQQLTYTVAFRKQFWNKNASIGITATNPFNKYVNQITTVNTDNYTSYYRRQIPYRSFGISFTYKFGKLDFGKKKEDDNYLNSAPDMGN